ncbi:MAG TPA: FAD-linked oxidase C-terminal domain-containing protein [Bacteroidales bacterium]|nr:FAD-linked oxidase C-terminal domain-containing protein [Bacteroidales bacterium]HRZ50187.1 FAD-linked oxidase C-terminal domain-containing protein [Bacteroidales bacterium]
MTPLEELKDLLPDRVFDDITHKSLYATDASVYREIPLAVAFPQTNEELQGLVLWAAKHSVPLIPRAAGTSLAGQVVGSGVVVDTGRYMNRILSVDPETRTAWVQPGVIRDDLNRAVKPYNLHFAPETSTSNRCMMGGMVGNNACGAHSLLYGSTRDHLLEVKGFLADGSPVHFKPVDETNLHDKAGLNSLEGTIYGHLLDLLSNETVRNAIIQNAPWPDIRRRNTGYALDLLIHQKPWNPEGKDLNLCELIAGSEGTLMMISEIKVGLEPLLPQVSGLLCAHFGTLDEAFRGNLVALQYPVSSIELIDNVILECTSNHQGLHRNRFFIKGDPKGVLLIEICSATASEMHHISDEITKALTAAGLGYHYPLVTGAEIGKVWELRKAGLGLLSNVKGNAKPVPVIEDTAVRPQDLPDYMADFQLMLDELGLTCVYYAHISTGELHLRPVLDLKNPEHLRLFREVATRTAQLVKKYRGSLSGEHGDGRLRGEFIPLMAGEEVYRWFCELKRTWDPSGILNPGKITATPPMDSSMRYSGAYTEPVFTPVFDYREDGGFLQAIERCNGSGDCRRPFWYEGVMCPSYQASSDERLSTRGRSNLLREALSRFPDDPFSYPALKEILDQCLSCKGCKQECPSAVDMARYKAEVMHQYYLHHGTPLHVSMVANLSRILRMFSRTPRIYNTVLSLKPVSSLIKSLVRIHPKRDLPRLSVPSFVSWIRKNPGLLQAAPEHAKGKVVLYIDEFTELFDTSVAKAAIRLLHGLGYGIIPYYGRESGRAAFSKGKLAYARKCAVRNVQSLHNLVDADTPLIGTEPSAILAFVDEYPSIVPHHLQEAALHIASHTMLMEEFIVQELEAGNITGDQFHDAPARIVVHGHCHQKSLKPSDALSIMLGIPVNHTVEVIKSGCCGMAGSFGMEQKNYALSMQIGEQILFPYLRNIPDGTMIAIAGTSCRQQVLDGTGLIARHPVEILTDALVNPTNTI